MKWDGTTWTASNPTSGADTLRYSPIGCAPTGTFCAAGGDYGTGNAYLWTYDGVHVDQGAGHRDEDDRGRLRQPDPLRGGAAHRRGTHLGRHRLDALERLRPQLITARWAAAFAVAALRCR